MWILGVVLLLLGVAVSIGLHELGHYLPAKRFGVYVQSFFIGFGPTIWHRHGKETVFGFKAIPLGGFVALSGMYPPTANADRPGFRLFRKLVQDARDASAETIVDEKRAFYRLPVWQRVIIMLGGPFANLLIAAVLFLILFSGIGVVSPTLTIASVSECVIPVTMSRDTCLESDPVAPAKAAGFTPGDTVLTVDGTPMSQWSDATDAIRTKAKLPMTFVVERGGQHVTLTVTPAESVRYQSDSLGNLITLPNGQYATETVGFLGVSPVFERQQQSPAVALTTLGSNVAQTGAMIVQLPQRMVDVWNAAFGTAPRAIDGPLSVVGVGRLAGDITASNTLDIGDRLQTLLGILASLNVALFVFNLLPLLPLDGGHVVVALWEAIRNGIARLRGKKSPGPVDSARLVPITVVMTVILMAMSALLIYADIVKPITLPL